MSDNEDLENANESVEANSTSKPTAKKRNRKQKKNSAGTTAVENCTSKSKGKVFSNATHKTKLLSMLNRDRKSNRSYCDVTIRADGQDYPVHKCIVGKLSNFFDKMFFSEMKERYDSVATIHNVSSEAMETIINFMYSGSVTLTDDNVMELLVAADYLQVIELKKFCVVFLGESLDKTNCLSIKLNGQLFNCPALSDKAETTAVQNFAEVIQQLQFKELDKSNVISFLSSRDQKAFGSKEVYEGVISWVYHDLEQRKKDFNDLFKIVKLHLLPVTFLEEEVSNQELVKASHECKDYFQKELLYRLMLSSLDRKQPDSANTVGNSSQSNKVDNKPGASKQIPAKPKKTKNTKVLPKDGVAGSDQPSSKPLVKQNAKINPNSSQKTKSTSSPADNTTDDDINFSKELVRILRHGKYPELTRDSEGFVSTQQILTNKKIRNIFGNKTLKDIRRILNAPGKKRFELKLFDTVWMIRALGGHTIPISKCDDAEGDGPSVSKRNSIASTTSEPSTVPYPGNAEVSKELVRILRHGRYEDIKVDSGGYAFARKILNHPRFRNFCGDLDMDDLEYIVESNEKRYFELKLFGTEWKIRALHGHTVEVDNLELTPILDTSFCRFVHHKTTHANWKFIQLTGLSRMKREYIHFYPDIPTQDGISAELKPHLDIAVLIDLAQAISAGLKFYKSDDGNTVLSSGNERGFIPTHLFSHVIQLRPVWARIQ